MPKVLKELMRHKRVETTISLGVGSQFDAKSCKPVDLTIKIAGDEFGIRDTWFTAAIDHAGPQMRTRVRIDTGTEIVLGPLGRNEIPLSALPCVVSTIVMFSAIAILYVWRKRRRIPTPWLVEKMLGY